MEQGGLGVQSVTVRFGGLVAIDDVTLQVQPGEVLGVIGPNGAGKTTLFNVICGFVRPNQGRVVFEGAELVSLKPHSLTKLGIARTLQGLGLCSHMTVIENVMAGANAMSNSGFVSGFLGIRKSARDERRLADLAGDTLNSLNLHGYEYRLPTALPYAIQKKVALARALISSPKYVLLDEPASGLSNAEMDELGELIRGLTTSAGVMLVEHHMDLVMAVCDRIDVLDFGKLIAEGAPSEIRSNPLVLEAYLGEEVDPHMATAGGTLSVGEA